MRRTGICFSVRVYPNILLNSTAHFRFFAFCQFHREGSAGFLLDFSTQISIIIHKGDTAGRRNFAGRIQGEGNIIMKIGIGNDHAAVEMKREIMAYLQELGHEVVNYGTDSTASCNYPEYGEKVGRAVVAGEVDCAVLICGTGVGISIAANKVDGVRAAVCSDTATARLVKQHNNANIIAFGQRIVGIELAKDIVKAYLDAEFMGGRHQTRIDMIHEIETRK